MSVGGQKQSLRQPNLQKEITMKNLDTIKVMEISGVKSAIRSEVLDSLCIKNEYHIVATEPVPEQRERFIKLREQIASIEASNFILRAMRSAKLDSLKIELEAIPQEKIWEETVCNLMPTVGKNNMLDNHWAASAYTAAWYCGLINTTAYTGLVVGDTMASHGGWTEDTNYTQANRVAPSFSASAAGSKATSAAMVFTMNAATTIKGLFMCSVSTKGGITGVLASEVLFSGGDNVCTAATTLSVSFSSSLT